MKILTIFGVGSLVANAALLGVLGYGALVSKPSRPASLQTETPLASAPAAKPEARDIWTNLKSDTLAAQRDMLQAEGFPATAVRAILAAQIREQFAARRKSLEAASQDQPYWKSPLPNPQTQAQLQALANEEQKILRELLGPDPFDSQAARLRRDFPGLPTEKVDVIATIRERYDEMRQETFGAVRGSNTPSEREKMANLEKAMHQEIAAVLAKEELEEYDLRTSSTANQLRYNLVEFDATEAEFRTLFRLQSAFDDENRFFGGGQTQEQQKARSEAQKRLNDEIAATLGSVRYADYQRATDYSFRQASQLVSRLNLPPETATKLYGVQKEVEEQRNALYRGMPSAQQRSNEPFAALATDATARITAIFGGNKTATDLYKLYGGTWLTNLAPRPAPPSSAKK